MKKLVLLTLLVSSNFAFAGPAERAFMKDEAEPTVKAAAESYKTNCGCALAVNVKWDDFTAVDDMRSARNTIRNIIGGAKEYCVDAGAKKAMCAMKEIEIKKDKSSSIAFAKGKMTITLTGPGESFGWDAMTKTVDK